MCHLGGLLGLKRHWNLIRKKQKETELSKFTSSLSHPANTSSPLHSLSSPYSAHPAAAATRSEPISRTSSLCPLLSLSAPLLYTHSLFCVRCSTSRAAAGTRLEPISGRSPAPRTASTPPDGTKVTQICNRAPSRPKFTVPPSLPVLSGIEAGMEFGVLCTRFRPTRCVPAGT